MKYRKKPVVIDAYQFTQKMVEDYCFDKIPLPQGLQMANCNYHLEDRKLYSYKVMIDTLEGETYKVEIGDWIIRGVKGEFYPCKPDVFEKTYEKVEETKPEGGAE